MITREPIDVSKLRKEVGSSECGAVVTFEGVVRDHDSGEVVSAIHYEAYESMAAKQMLRVVQEVSKDFPNVQMAAAHRIGLLVVGEVSVVVVAAAPHREEAFLAGRRCIDEIKKSVPIWKKQLRNNCIESTDFLHTLQKS